jgi:FkbM family methyltransferase
MSVRQLPAVLRYVWNHPLSANRRWARLRRFVQWQIACRLLPGAAVVPFVNDTRLCVRRGMHAGTGNIYTGLQEFDEMAFVLHALRPDDLFVDVGANVGTYTLLAAGAVGCRCICAEPVEKAFGELGDNLRVNQLEGRVEAHRIAVGAEVGRACITTSLDSRNQIVDADRGGDAPADVVSVTTLDALLAGRSPAIIKIDVEGYEPQVLAGAVKTLQQSSLLAVLVEVNRDVQRGADDVGRMEEALGRAGLKPCRYDGLTRRLAPASLDRTTLNALFVRRVESVAERCRQAPRFRVLDAEV